MSHPSTKCAYQQLPGSEHSTPVHHTEPGPGHSLELSADLLVVGGAAHGRLAVIQQQRQHEQEPDQVQREQERVQLAGEADRSRSCHAGVHRTEPAAHTYGGTTDR